VIARQMAVQALRRRLRPARLGWQRRLAADRVPVRPPRGVVSFTFDDVPRSAYLRGAPLLEEVDARGTFYVAARLGEPGGDGLGRDDIVDLHHRGHQIACHTWSHLRAARGQERHLVEDCRRNREALSEILDGAPVEDFSFPFGTFSYRAKRALGREYASLRSIDSGLNVRTADLRLLYGHALAVDRFDEAELTELLDRCAAERGWLVLYTHGVDPTPDAFSVTPGQFARAIELATTRPLDLLPIADARAVISDRSWAPPRRAERPRGGSPRARETARPPAVPARPGRSG
jgi:peptidoglycan/xylan/chitin deacetylase (PgdA/CDA1 family)